MHILLDLSSMLFVLLGSYILLGILHHIRNWSQRRTLQLFVLTMPIVTFGLGMSRLHDVIGYNCFRSIPTWDALLGVVLPLGIGAVALSAIGLGVVRLLLMAQVVTRRGVFANPELQTCADTLAQRLNTPRSRVLLCTYDRPLALTYGVFRPAVLLSTWMVEHLDQRELEAVLAHELEHVARRDYLVIWFATVLRDAFFYLPTSRAAYRQLQHEKELACDDLVVSVTHRPLALASALAKVWQNAVNGPRFARFGLAQSLVEVGESINGRIERLLASHSLTTNTQPTRVAALGVSASTLFTLVVAQGANLIMILALMGCDPTALLQRLF